ncbi:hypothetical protein COCSUDRAFT_60683 [Coccomyxa subellipsoidea C-169]|uniref:Protein kinase domain-containing protein n=1 Tax=Coccomyxa subellipsoidea (strain C-169) TaxID=574566 RepID=I0Z4V0_COCSC|nr:hypothetical protein COCSUDRAFT_60683 [Coccomyxa subellipsoidea C-169]EIE25669.1 hypothetical protein COCSUDRAFT_60683 [Coccomyxa subellipsoidea C-169]|eukprot:XP_005650213.1 hypothetical protein COCSUDRAFT_60683 [Coccomyxa subellipsoidea C-169]
MTAACRGLLLPAVLKNGTSGAERSLPGAAVAQLLAPRKLVTMLTGCPELAAAALPVEDVSSAPAINQHGRVWLSVPLALAPPRIGVTDPGRTESAEAQVVFLKSEETGEQRKLKLHDLQPDGTGRLDWAAAKEAFGADLLEIEDEGTPGLLQEGGRKGLTRDTYKPGENILVIVARRAQDLARPLLAETASYTSVAKRWKEEGRVVLQTYLHQDEGEFDDFWLEKGAELQRLAFTAEVCEIETGNDVPYEDGAAILAGIWQHVSIPPGRRSEASFFIAKAAHPGQTRPDVAFLGYNTALIDRAERARKARKVDTFILPGGVTDNRLIRCAIVTASNDGAMQKMVANRNLLPLMREDLPTSGRNAIDTSSAGFKELTFLLWSAEREDLRLRAAAESNMSCEGPGTRRISVLASDGASVEADVHAVLSPPGLGGAVFSGSLPASSVPVIVKAGPAAGIVLAAEALCLEPEQFTQVPREAEALRRLGSHRHSSLPQLLHFGHCMGASGPIPVLITRKYGDTILLPGGRLPRLPHHELFFMAADVLSGILVLQDHGIKHSDVHPRNIGQYESSSTQDRERFYLFDLGAAVLDAELAPPRSPPCSPRFSSLDVIKGCPPGALSDVESLVYCVLALSGAGLPWDAAAAKGDRMVCITARVSMMADPSESGALSALPEVLECFCQQVLRASFDGQRDTKPSLQSWMHRLRKAGLSRRAGRGVPRPSFPAKSISRPLSVH